jgi:phage head maturation protease
MHATIELPRQLRAAEVRAQSFDENANTIDVVWTTGATVRRYDWLAGAYDEVLEVGEGNVRLERLNAGAPLLNSHNACDLDDVIGSVVPGSARMEAGLGVATVQLSRSEDDASVVQKIRDGIIRNISAGYIIHAVEKLERDDGSAPVWRVTDWEPVEISAVPVPADPGAQIRSAVDPAKGDALHPCLVTRAEPTPTKEARMAEKKTGTDGAKDVIPTEKDAPTQGNMPSNPVNPNDNPDIVEHEVNPKPKTGDGTAATKVYDPGDAHPLPLSEAEERRINALVEKRMAAERARANDITDLAKKFGLRDFGDQHIRTGTPVESFRGLLIDKLAAERGADGGPKHTAAAPEPSLAEQNRESREANQAHWRRVLNKPAPAAKH